MIVILTNTKPDDLQLDDRLQSLDSLFDCQPEQI